MEFRYFKASHSLPVITRRASSELLMLLSGTAEVISSRGRTLMCSSCYPNRQAYNMAVSRLRGEGLIAQRHEDGSTPTLKMTREGEARLPVVCRSRSPWAKKWKGVWYVLTYDVPEKDRQYRETLRSFLKRMRMGCLQKSVWVTAKDVRPEYSDLCEAAAIDDFAFLLDTRMVLGRSDQDIVCAAWDMDHLAKIQSWYVEACLKQLEKVRKNQPSEEIILTLLREEGAAYLSVMANDPLLPEPLWPKDYRGNDAWETHHEFTRNLARLL